MAWAGGKKENIKVKKEKMVGQGVFGINTSRRRVDFGLRRGTIVRTGLRRITSERIGRNRCKEVSPQTRVAYVEEGT